VRTILLSLFLLPAYARADSTYHIQSLSENEVLRAYREMLVDACRDADREWKTSKFDPQAGYWGDGVSGGNQGIRTIGCMVLASGTLLKYDDSLRDSQRHELLEKTIAALRFVAATHVTGGQKCADGKDWGATESFGAESWQSGMWTGTFAFGAWLVWDRLDPALRERLEQIIAWEADILAKRQPPTGLWLDTKAEENAWEVPCLVLGEVMFPAHAHAAAWHDAAVKYMMNTLCTEGDAHDDRVIDGRAVREWVNGANVQPDFTLENHNIFHPAYVGCSSYFLTQAAMYYTFAGRPAPQAASHHLLDTWRIFQSIILPWGEAAYPQGMDWELHGLPFINLYAALATHWQDPLAARMEQSILQYLRTWQKMGGGSLAIPGSRLGITRSAINAEQAAYGFLAHKIFGPSVKPLTGPAAAAQVQGVRDYPYVDFIAHRTEKKFASFSWKNRIMGLLIPIGDGHDDNPDFSTPIPDGLIGSFDLAPRGDLSRQVLEHVRKETASGFETSGTVLINGGRLKQMLTMISIGSQAVVYEDRVTAVTDVTMNGEHGVALGIENDEITGGIRTVTDREGRREFSFHQPQPIAALAGPWVNVDDRMSVIMLGDGAAGLAYQQASGYSKGISVCSDILYGSFSDKARSFRAGDEVAHRIALVFLEVTARETAAMAGACHIEATPAGRVLHFTQPDGPDAQVPLRY
jgi:hypothetical protein